jgi:hypothetical protein
MQTQSHDGVSRLVAHCEGLGRRMRTAAGLVAILAAVMVGRRLWGDPQGTLSIVADGVVLLVFAWVMWDCGTGLRSEAAEAVGAQERP